MMGKVSSMLGRMHSDMVDQIVTNEMSADKSFEQMFTFMTEWKLESDRRRVEREEEMNFNLFQGAAETINR